MLKSFALAVLWRTVAYRVALDVVIPATSERRGRVSLTNTFLVALAVSVTAAACGLLMLLPGIGLLAWLVPIAVWIVAFVVGFGLHAQGLAVLFGAELVSVVLIRLAAWWLGW